MLMFCDGDDGDAEALTSGSFFEWEDGSNIEWEDGSNIEHGN